MSMGKGKRSDANREERGLAHTMDGMSPLRKET
jgi:hypothetical protein